MLCRFNLVICLLAQGLVFSATTYGQATDANAIALDFVDQALGRVESLEEYSCLMHRQDRIDGELRDPQAFRYKYRNDPLAFYCGGVTRNVKSTELLFLDSKHDNKVLIEMEWGCCIPRKLSPNGSILMRNMRHPVTEWGIYHSTKRVHDLLVTHAESAEFRSRIITDCKINGRSCTLLEFRFADASEIGDKKLVRMFVDNELEITNRVAMYDLSAGEDNAQPELIEAYTFLEIDLAPGFTDDDFDDSRFLD